MTFYQKIACCCLLFFSLYGSLSFAQDTTKNLIDSYPQKDLVDVFSSVFKSKKHKADTSIKAPPKKNQFALVPVLGYTLQTGFAFDFSGNLVYRRGHKDSTNLSNWLGGISYTEKDQLLFYLQSTAWSKNNKWNFTTDCRFYKYPQNTYGLGGFTKPSDAILVKYNFFRLYETAFKKVKENIYLGVGYMLDMHWKITQERTILQPITDFDTYGYKTESNSSGVCINFLSDTRDNPVNAYKGFYSNILFRYNTTLLGSDNEWTALIIDVRKFIQLDKKHTILAIRSYNWFTPSGKAPYLDLPSTAWDPLNNLGRGYIQSRFRSPNLLYVESELRFNLTRNNLLGAAVFANAQSYSEWQTDKFEKVLPGIGAGLRLKFNKHSRTNLAVDYAFGLNGSGGIFVNLGEVF